MSILAAHMGAIMAGGGGGGGTSVTWNSADKAAPITLSESDKLATKTSSGAVYHSARCTTSHSTGKWYFEMEVDEGSAPGGGTEVLIGIGNASASLSTFVGGDANGWGYYRNGNKTNSPTNTAYGATYTELDIIGVAWDADAGTLEFFKNGVSQGQAFTGVTGTLFPMGSFFQVGEDALRCITRTYPLPSGFLDW